MIAVLVVVLVVVIVFAVLRLNGRTARRGGAPGAGYSRNSRLQRQARDEASRNAAAREQLAAGLPAGADGADETAEQCLGLTFGPSEASDASGLVVAAVRNGSAAGRVGLAAGAVLVSVNGAAVTTVEQADAAIAGRRAGIPVYVGWRVDGQDHRAEVIV